MKKHKIIELILIPLYYLFIAFVVILFHLEYVGTVSLFFGIPAIYLSLKNEKMFLRNLGISMLVGLMVIIPMDFIATVGGAWYETSLSGVRFFGTFPIESFLWAILSWFFTISFYKTFVNTHITKQFFSRDTKKHFGLVSLVIIVIVVFLLAVVLIEPKELLLYMHIYLFWLLGFFVIPLTIICLLYPHFLFEIWKQGIYFLILGIIYEYAALRTGQWGFTAGSYVGILNLGGVSFPIEELICWFLAPVTTLVLYKYYFEDVK